MQLIDPELLRTFLAFVDAGSLARASSIVGRTPSAITAQMQRLADAVGGPVLTNAGRGRALTPLGEELIVHARRILEVNREAWLSLKGASVEGTVVLGTTQDFADSAMPDLLRAFARTHARVRLEFRVGRSGELVRDYEDGRIDVLVVMRQSPEPDEIAVVREPMIWLAARDGLVATHDELPIAVLDPPCGFRSAGIATLEAAHRPYRIAASSGSLSGLRAAVRGGIALTPRTRRALGGDIVEAPEELGLPELPDAEFSIRLRQHAPASASVLGQLLCMSLDGRSTRTKTTVKG